ncbi:MAG: hypothetical protein Q9162_000823 [Coniocarpon cinnabarinum]
MGGLENVPILLSERGVNTIILTFVFWGLAALLLCLRLYTNSYIRRRLTASDWLCVAGFITYTPMAIGVVLAALYAGQGYHATTIDPLYMENNRKLTLLGETAYPISLSLTKMSICYLLSTIFPMRPFRIACLCLGILSGCWAIITILVGYLACNPLAYNWDPHIKGHCGNLVAAWTFIGVMDVVIDASIFVLPFPMLMKLKMRTGRKLAVSSVFFVAAITIFIGIIRTVEVANSYVPDWTWTGYHVWIWTGIEPSIAIMVACMMTLRPLFLVVWPRIRRSFGLPMPCGNGDDLDFESYTYPNDVASRYRYGRSRESRHAQPPPTTQTQRSMSPVHLNDNRGYSEDTTATVTRNTSEASTLSAPQKSKQKTGTWTPEFQDLARKASIPENDVFSVGATPALEPAGHLGQPTIPMSTAGPMPPLPHVRTDPSTFSIGATPQLEAPGEARKKTQAS